MLTGLKAARVSGFKPRQAAGKIAALWLAGGDIKPLIRQVPQEYRALVVDMAKSSALLIDHWARSGAQRVPRKLSAAVHRRRVVLGLI